MSIGKRIAAKRAEKVRNFVDVEGWGEGDDPLRLYFTEASARDLEKITRKYKEFLTHPSMSAMVEMIIMKCEDEKGDAVFTLEDKADLLGEPIGKIASVFGSVFNADSVEEHEKN